jgi:regulator of replication initiation timing
MQYIFEHHEMPEISELDVSLKHLVKLSSRTTLDYPGWATLVFMSDMMITQFHSNTLGVNTYNLEPILIDISQETVDYLKSQLRSDPMTSNAYSPDHHAMYIIANEIYHMHSKYDDDLAKLNAVNSNQKAEVDLLKHELRILQDTIEYQSKQNASLQLENKRLRKELTSLMRQQSPDRTKGYVYLLSVDSHDDLFKIGRTKNPKNRLATFNVKLPFPVSYEHVIETDDMYQLESELHKRFKDKRQSGSEFFLLDKSDVAYIKGFQLKTTL